MNRDYIAHIYIRFGEYTSFEDLKRIGLETGLPTSQGLIKHPLHFWQQNNIVKILASNLQFDILILE